MKFGRIPVNILQRKQKKIKLNEGQSFFLSHLVEYIAVFHYTASAHIS